METTTFKALEVGCWGTNSDDVIKRICKERENWVHSILNTFFFFKGTTCKTGVTGGPRIEKTENMNESCQSKLNINIISSRIFYGNDGNAANKSNFNI